MNEQEAARLADRLRRVWKPDKGTIRSAFSDSTWWYWRAQIAGRDFSYEVSDIATYISWFDGSEEEGPPHFYLNSLSPYIQFFRIPDDEQSNLFASQHLPAFRCNCFLSGAKNIEATFTEKMEWTRTAIEEKRLTEDEGRALLEAPCTI